MNGGFKITELGFIPENWAVVSIGEISKVVRGASPRPQGDPRYYGGDVPRLMGSDVSRDGKYVTPKVDYLTEEGAKKSRFMPAGTLTMICSGDVGVPSILAVDACIHDGFLAFPEISDSCDKSFLFYIFDSLHDKFNKSATHGGIFTNLTTTIIKDFKIPFPPISEQQKIAGILSTVDEKIDIINNQIAEIKKLKEGLVERLFTKGIAHSQFKDSVLGKIPQSWKVKYVNEFAKIGTGAKDTQNKVNGGSYPFIVRSQKVEKINSYSFDGEAVLTAGDGVGVGKVFHYLNCKFDYHQRVYNVHHFENEVSGKYFFEYFKQNFRKQVRKYNAKGSVDSVRMDMIAKMVVPIPPKIEQEKIVSILAGIDDKQNVLDNKLREYQNLKSGLMQKLLTGKIRVNSYQQQSAVA